MRVVSLIILIMMFSLGLTAQDSNTENTSHAKKELLFFSNNGCGKCSRAQSYFDKHQMPYEKLAVKENRPLMYEFIHQKTGGKNIGIRYPVLVYGDSIYFNFKNVNQVLNEIETMMKQDGLIVEKNKTNKD